MFCGVNVALHARKCDKLAFVDSAVFNKADQT